jgi:hypothetical protein
MVSNVKPANLLFDNLQMDNDNGTSEISKHELSDMHLSKGELVSIELMAKASTDMQHGSNIYKKYH